MLGWMAYVIVVTLLLSAAAFAAERSAHLRRAATRWIWLAAILASLFLPSVIASVSVQAPALHPKPSAGAASDIVALRQLTSTVLQPAAWANAAAGPPATSPQADRLLQAGWSVASGVLLVALFTAALRLHRRKRAWVPAVVCGERVLLSEDVGPAVVGLLRPRIVLPSWFADGPAGLQQMVIAHERSHLRAGDARLLAIALLLIVAMPWNLPLWWQLRRLRFAIEMDCDARVLEAGCDVAAYGRTLLAVGERQSARMSVVAGMAESRTFLEERLRRMLAKKKKFAWVAALGFGALGLVFAASAAQVSPPNAGPAAGHKEIKIDPGLLDKYAGFYLLGDKAVLAVKREGDHLTIQLTGQPSAPIFPESPTSFFAKVVDAQFSFQTDGAGKVTGVALRQFGRTIILPRTDAATAAQVNARTEARVKAQTASPGTEAAVRLLDTSIAAGKPAYEAMTPTLAEVTRPQAERLQAYLSGLGPIEEVRFLGVNPQGADVYLVRHQKGIVRWLVALDPDGKVASAMVSQGP